MRRRAAVIAILLFALALIAVGSVGAQEYRTSEGGAGEGRVTIASGLSNVSEVRATVSFSQNTNYAVGEDQTQKTGSYVRLLLGGDQIYRENYGEGESLKTNVSIDAGGGSGDLILAVDDGTATASNVDIFSGTQPARDVRTSEAEISEGGAGEARVTVASGLSNVSEVRATVSFSQNTNYAVGEDQTQKTGSYVRLLLGGDQIYKKNFGEGETSKEEVSINADEKSGDLIFAVDDGTAAIDNVEIDEGQTVGKIIDNFERPNPLAEYDYQERNSWSVTGDALQGNKSLNTGDHFGTDWILSYEGSGLNYYPEVGDNISFVYNSKNGDNIGALLFGVPNRSTSDFYRVTIKVRDMRSRSLGQGLRLSEFEDGSVNKFGFTEADLAADQAYEAEVSWLKDKLVARLYEWDEEANERSSSMLLDDPLTINITGQYNNNRGVGWYSTSRWLSDSTNHRFDFARKVGEIKAKPCTVNIVNSSFRIESYPVKEGEVPEVSVDVECVDGVQIKVNDDEPVDMNKGSGNTWTKEIDSGEFDSVEGDIGERVELTITAGDETLSKIGEAYPRSQLPRSNDTVPGTEQLHYYIFDNIVETPVVLAKFEGQNLSDFNLDSEENVTQWERAREYDMNTYMGSGRGSSGQIGYDLEYKDNGSDFHTVGQKSEYSSPGVLTPKTVGWGCEFAHEAKEEASLGSGEWIATHPGRSNQDAFINGDPPFRCDERNTARGYMSMGENKNAVGGDHYGVWTHEFSHLHLGMGDLYSNTLGGNVFGGLGGNTDIMAGQLPTNNGRAFVQGIPILPQPYSVLSRTELNDLGEVDPKSSADRPWAELNETELDRNEGVTVPVQDVNEIELGDEVGIVDTGESEGSRFPVGSRGEIKYLVEGMIDNDKVRGYRVLLDRGTLNTAESINDSEGIDGYETNVWGTLDAEFHVDAGKVTVEPSTDPTVIKFSMTPSISTGIGSTVSGSTRIRPRPEIDLRAVDSQGRVTGVNEDGEFVNEIPGADASGDTNGREWVSLPNGADVEFEVSSDDVQKFIEETDVSAENVTARYTTTVSTTGPDAEVVNGSDGVTVTDSTTKVIPVQTIEPGETKTVGASVDVNVTQDTLNKRSEGQWIKVDVGSPSENVDVADVNLSTVELNGEVEAVDDDRYGFVLNPVNGDTLKMRFPRDEVSEILETGEEVSIRITGETEDGTAIVGNDEIRVINPGREQGPGGSPGEEPSGGAPGQGSSNSTTNEGQSETPSGGQPNDTPDK